MEDPKKFKLESGTRQFMETTSSNDESDIFKLNTDCLTYIFSFLPIVERVRIQRVCKRWQKASKLPWHDMKKLNIGRKRMLMKNGKPIAVDDSILKQLLSLCGACVTHVNLSETVQPLTSTDLLVLLKKMCPNIESIKFGYSIMLTRKGLEFLTDNFNDIKDCVIGRCWKGCEDILSTFLSNNKRLQSFTLNDSNTITGSCFFSLPAETIEFIEVYECKQILPENLINALQSFHKLHTFVIIEYIMKANIRLMEHINEILGSIPVKSNLKTLRLSYQNSQWQNHNNILHVYNISKLSNLNTLELCGNFILHDGTLMIVTEHCKQLTHVIFSDSSYMTDVGLQSITSLPKLEHLSLTFVENITNNGFTEMPKLKYLKCYQCTCINIRHLFRLMKTSENLQWLEFKYCGNTDALISDAKRATRNRTNDIILQICVHANSTKQPSYREVTKISSHLHIISENLFSMPDLELFFDS